MNAQAAVVVVVGKSVVTCLIHAVSRCVIKVQCTTFSCAALGAYNIVSRTAVAVCVMNAWVQPPA